MSRQTPTPIPPELAKRGLRQASSNLPEGHHVDLHGSLFAFFGEQLMQHLQQAQQRKAKP